MHFLSAELDGVTGEHLNSIFLGGDRDDAYKGEMLSDYVAFLNRCIKSDLTENQKKVLHSLRLAAAPKTEEESRVMTTLGIHWKIIFSSFAASKLKRRVEAIVHTFQQVIVQNPDYDI